MISRRDLLKTTPALAAAARSTLHAASAAPSATRIWYRTPAAGWNDALPMGNGHLGGMVFGRVAQERIQLNEHSLWSGAPAEDDKAETREALPMVRELLFAGK